MIFKNLKIADFRFQIEILKFVNNEIDKQSEIENLKSAIARYDKIH